MHIGREVEKFLRRSNMPPTRFGRLACNDLRNGREPRRRVAQRIVDFINAQDAAQ
jgi:hypothetical protein